jgi:hypothetical protein
VPGELEHGDRRRHQGAERERHQRIAHCRQVARRAARHVVGQEHIDGGVEHASAQRLGDGCMGELQKELQHEVGEQQLVGGRAAERLGVGAHAQGEPGGQQDGEREQPRVVDDEDVLHEAESRDFAVDGGHGEKHEEVERQLVRLGGQREDQEQRGESDEQPEVVGEEGGEREGEPEVAPACVVLVRHRRGAGERLRDGEHRPGEQHDHQQGAQVFRHRG